MKKFLYLTQIICLCSILSILWVNNALSKSSLSMVELSNATKTVKDLSNIALEDIESVLTKNEKPIFDNLKFQISTEENIETVYTTAKGNDVIINISLGYLFTTVLLLDAFYVAPVLGNSEQLNHYQIALIHYLTDQEGIYKKPLTFNRFIGVPDKVHEDFRKRFPQGYPIEAIFAFTIGHELGHHFLKHPMEVSIADSLTNATKNKMELEADKVSFELLDRLVKKGKMQYLLMNIMPIEFFFLRVEDYRMAGKERLKLAEKRLHECAKHSIKQCESNEKILEKLKEIGAFDKYLQFKKQMNEINWSN